MYTRKMVRNFFSVIFLSQQKKAEAEELERVACNVNQIVSSFTEPVDFLNQKSFTKAPTFVYKSRTAFSIDYRYKN